MSIKSLLLASFMYVLILVNAQLGHKDKVIELIMKYCVFLVFAFCFQLSYSQSVFNSGYIISNQNDTTYGLIENNSFVENAKYCVFKKSDNSEKIR